MIELRELTNEEVVKELGSKTLRARVRKLIYHRCALIEQLQQQLKPIGIVEQRRLELGLAQEVIDLVVAETK